MFQRLYNWVQEALASPIEIAKLDADGDDIATALSNCVLRDGTGKPTAAMDWNNKNLTGVNALTAVTLASSGNAAFQGQAPFAPTATTALVWTPLSFASNVAQRGTAYAASVFTAPVTGWYHFSSGMSFGILSGSVVYLSLFKNGATGADYGENYYQNINGSSTVNMGLTVSATVYLTVGETIQPHYYSGNVGNSYGQRVGTFSGHFVA